jgi:RsiW-degrading membrane proteinase PrsW (M82 family)
MEGDMSGSDSSSSMKMVLPYLPGALFVILAIVSGILWLTHKDNKDKRNMYMWVTISMAAIAIVLIGLAATGVLHFSMKPAISVL